MTTTKTAPIVRQIAVAAALVAGVAAAQAVTIAPAVAWRCGDGDWSTAACWTTGALPGIGDDVTVNTPANSWSTVQYSLPSTTIANLALQTVVNSNNTIQTIRQRSGSLTVTGTTTLGAAGYGTYMLDDGAFTTKSLLVGSSLGSVAGSGTFMLWGGTLRTGVVFSGGSVDGGTVIGRDGRGDFMQGGGLHHATMLTLGAVIYNVPPYSSDAYYRLNDGNLQVDHSIHVNGMGAGTSEFGMSAGTVDVRFGLDVSARSKDASATWNQSGGTTTAAFTTVGMGNSLGGGSLVLSGTATLKTTAFTVGEAGLPYWGAIGLAPAFATSYLTLAGWSATQQTSLQVVRGDIGLWSKAVAYQYADTTAIFSERLTLGGTVLGHGTYNLMGGSLQTPLLNLAWTPDYNSFLSRTGTAVFMQSGGALSTDTLKIGRAGSYSLSGGTLAVAGDVVNDGSFSATGGTFSIGGNITNNGTWSVSAAKQTFAGTTEFGGGSKTHLADGATATFSGLVIERTGAQFTGGGTKVFLGGLSVGASPGLVNESGNVTFGDANLYTAEIGGTTAGTGFDAYRVAGALHLGGTLVLTTSNGFEAQADLGGTLVLTTSNGFEAQAGQRFDLFDWGTLNGSFAHIDSSGLKLAPNTALDLSQLYVDGSVSVTAVPEPASMLMLAAGLGLLVARMRRRA